MTLYISDFWKQIDGTPISITSKKAGRKVVLIALPQYFYVRKYLNPWSQTHFVEFLFESGDGTGHLRHHLLKFYIFINFFRKKFPKKKQLETHYMISFKFVFILSPPSLKFQFSPTNHDLILGDFRAFFNSVKIRPNKYLKQIMTP